MSAIRTAARMVASVVVPTFNEARNLPELVRRVAAALPGVEIVVVDDASTDGTPAAARALAAEFPVRLVERTSERGLSTAILRGLEEAGTDCVLVIDADLSHPPERLPDLLRAVEEGADMAVGSRYVPGGAIDKWPLRRRLASRAGTLVARPLTSVRDPMAGFFCVRRSRLAGLGLKPRGFKILLEILARGRDLRVVEVPIRFEDRVEGTSKFDGLQRREFLRQAWRLYRDLNAWPYRLLKFLATGFSGYVLHLAVLAALVEVGGHRPIDSAIAAFALAMTWNYALNRFWTFRAPDVPTHLSYPAYAAGALGGLAVQVGVMHLLRSWHYAIAASLGIALGMGLTFLTAQAWAFVRRSEQ